MGGFSEVGGGRGVVHGQIPGGGGSPKIPKKNHHFGKPERPPPNAVAGLISPDTALTAAQVI